MAEALAVSRQALSHKEYAATQEIDNAEEESGNAEAKRHLGNNLLIYVIFIRNSSQVPCSRQVRIRFPTFSLERCSISE
jgi:hypothetical protein